MTGYRLQRQIDQPHNVSCGLMSVNDDNWAGDLPASFESLLTKTPARAHLGAVPV